MFTSIITPAYPQSNSFYQSFLPRSNLAYTPHHPSPLQTSRNVNRMPQTNLNNANGDKATTSKQRHPFNPAAHLSRLVSTTKAARNTAHRKRAANRRADAYLDERYDQVSRMEWMREQKKWEERMRKWGQKEMVYNESEFEDAGDETMQDNMETSNDGQEEQMSIPPDEEELDALLEYLDSDNGATMGASTQVESITQHQRANSQSKYKSPPEIVNRRLSQTYGSDEDEYDRLFMEVIRSSQTENEASRTQLQEAMDIS